MEIQIDIDINIDKRTHTHIFYFFFQGFNIFENSNYSSTDQNLAKTDANSKW